MSQFAASTSTAPSVALPTRKLAMRAVIPRFVTLPSRRVLFACLLLLAFALRVVGLDFGLPFAEARPDEQTIAYQAMKFGRGDLNPHSFNYPSLYKYIVFGLFGGDYVVGKALGRFAGQEDFLRAFFAADGEFRLIMRAFSAVMGTVGVALLARGPGALFSAALLAVNFLHVRDSHFGVTDITMTTLVTASALLAERFARQGGTRTLVAAALVGGLATSTKYNAGLLAIPLAIACFYAPDTDGSLRPVASRLRSVATAGGIMLAGFVAGTPYAVLDFPTFIRDFTYEFSHLESGQYVDVGRGWLAHATRTLPDAMGIVGLIVGVFGIGVAFRQRGGRAWVLYSFPILYFLVIGRGQLGFYRYMLPVVPFLCMAAGAVLARFAKRTTRVRSTVNLAACVAMPLLASIQADRLFLAGDTRAAMGPWIEANVPTESAIVHAGAFTGAPMLQRNVPNNEREFAAKAGRSDSSGFRKPDETKWYRRHRPMYDVQYVEKAGIDFASTVAVEAILRDPPEFFEVEDYPLQHYSAVPTAVTQLIAREYTLVHEEAAFADPPVRARFDQQDAFYMPVAGFREVRRMGPTLRLYRHSPPGPAQ